MSTIDIDLQKVLENYRDSNFPLYSSLEPIELRRLFNASYKKRIYPETIPMYEILESVITLNSNPIKLKIYYPQKKGNLPALMYFHGGGFVIRDDMNTYDQTCRLIASQVECAVIAVDYRLAPEHPFPAAAEDCYGATCWVAEHASTLGINQNFLGVWGESCGGNLSTVVSMMARDNNSQPLACQILISPMLDVNFERRSYHLYAKNYILTKETMIWFWRHYLSKEADRKNPYAVPVLSNNLSNLPKALIITTEFDVLRDEGEYYSHLLEQAGTSVKYCCFNDLIHGFFDLYYRLKTAQAACQNIFLKVKKLLYVECQIS